MAFRGGVQAQGGGMGMPPPAMGGANDPQIKMARVEMEGVTGMFNRLNDLCFKKCMCLRATFPEADLNVGEMSCADRCVGKYLEAQDRVGKLMQEYQQAQAAAQGMVPPQ